ncbi:MAG TPA: tetratricopeptide repeat protein [Allosphingosinicella sp.]|nr:tetratricopeptide repeat protein [Allosphingosinicella sp.]
MAASPMLRTLVLSSLLVAPATALVAAASGGSGGSSSPSMSAPQFDAAAEYRKGIEALQAQRFAEAKRSFGRVLEVAPRDANTNYLAGLADAGLQDLANARKHYEKAVKADKDMVLAHRELGITYAKLGQRPKAEAELALLTQLNTACAGSCAKTADLAASIAAVQAALASAPTARLETRPSLLFASASGGDRAYLDAVGLINEGRYEEAIASLQAARAAFGAHPDILTYLGFANRKLGRFETAETYYRAALAAAPTHKGATEYYGELMVERGDLEGAGSMLAKLETICDFGCAEADELRRWIESGHAPAS